MAVTPFKSSDNFNMAGFNEKIAEADNTYVAKTGGGHDWCSEHGR